MEEAAEVADDVVVVIRDDFREKLDDSDIATEARPDGAEFQADGTTADDHEFLRHGRERDGVVGRDDGFAVKLEKRKLNGSGAGRDDEITRRQARS